MERLLASLDDSILQSSDSIEMHDSPEDRVSITFDDGYQHLHSALPPLMESFSFRPIIFFPTAYLGRENSWDYSHSLKPIYHLSRAGIRGLADLGVTFGSHSHNHIDLTRLPAATLRKELTQSKNVLEDITGKPVDQISYPFGKVNSRVEETAKECGYRLGYTMQYPDRWDSDLVRGRIPVYAIDSPMSVKRKLTPGPLQVIEKIKSGLIHSCSVGTILLNRLKK